MNSLLFLGMFSVALAGDFDINLVEFDPVCGLIYAEEYLNDHADCNSVTSMVDTMAPVIVMTCHEDDAESELMVTPTGYFNMYESELREKNTILCADTWFVVFKERF